MKKYKITWYLGYMDLDPNAIKEKLIEMETEAESIDKVNFIQILPKEEIERYSTEIRYCVRTAFKTEELKDAKETVSDYGSHCRFIYVKEI